MTNQQAAEKATPRPWRDDGSMIRGEYQARMLVGGEDGDHPTIFIESQCTTAAEVEQFEANFDLIRRSVNQSAAVDGLVEAVSLFAANVESNNSLKASPVAMGSFAKVRAALKAVEDARKSA